MGRLAVYKLMYFVSITLTLLIVAVTAFMAFILHTNPNEYPIASILGLSMPLLLFINVLLFIYWAFRRRFWVWFPLIAILANIEYLTTMFQFSFEKDTRGDLKVATFNIRNFNNEITGYTAKEVAKFMDSENVDVLCFQELSPNMDFNIDSIKNAYHLYPYFSLPVGNGGDYRVSIFSKYPITDYALIPFPESSNCGMWADVDVNGKKVRIFNVHMQTTNLNQQRARYAKKKIRGDMEAEEEVISELTEAIENNSQIRAKQAELIRTSINKSPYPVILCGDFNDTPASYTYKELKGDLKDGFKESGKGYGYTFRGIYGLLRIDYIFYSPQFTGISYYSPSKNWSDHNPVISEIKF